MTIRSLCANTIVHMLLFAASLWGQCSMVYNVSVYNDGSVSGDYSTVYAYSTTSDNSTLCGCGHGNYQTTTTVYSPNGTPNSSSSAGMSSYVAVPTNGLMGTYTIVGGASLFCSCAGTVGGGGPSSSVVVQPTVSIQVEASKQQGTSGYVLTLDTTALTATGNPSGGTYSWQSGPKMVLAGSSSSPNTSVEGREQSSSSGDTWVQAGYTVSGSTASASVRFTVRATRRLVATTLGGPGSTLPVPSGYGYVTWITYYVRDQFDQTVELQGIQVTETLNTVSISHPIAFNPPDNEPASASSNAGGAVLDRLSVEYSEPIPANFTATRNQVLRLRDAILWPTQVQTYNSTYAQITYGAVSW